MTRIELLRTLDERHLSSSLVYEAMHIGAVLVIDGAPYRTADGGIDRERILATIRCALVRVPEFRLRLRASPLGLTTPAWVPDEAFDLGRHVFFAETPAELNGSSIRGLAGYGRGPLPIDRPLWDLTFTPLVDGRIALAARLHHVIGDGQWGFDIIQRVTLAAPEAPDPAVPLPALAGAPRSAWRIPLHALRAFAGRFPTLRAAWGEYWRKPFRKRVRRMLGRNVRPLKEQWIRRHGLRARYLPPTRVSVATVATDVVRARAAALGGSMNDLLVAAALGAADGDVRGLDTLVPVSRRRRGATGDARNHISMLRVHTDAGLGLAERVRVVRRAVRRALVGADAGDESAAGRMLGYATLMPLSDEPRYFGDARVHQVVALPVGDPRSELSVLALDYAGTLSVTAISRAELDVDAMTRRILSDLTSADPAGAEPIATEQEAAA